MWEEAIVRSGEVGRTIEVEECDVGVCEGVSDEGTPEWYPDNIRGGGGRAMGIEDSHGDVVTTEV